MNTSHSEYLLSVKDKTVENGLLPATVVDFYNAIFEYQAKAITAFSDTDCGAAFLRPDVQPVLDPDRVVFSEKQLSVLDGTMSELRAVIEHYQPGISLEGFAGYCGRGGGIVERAFRSLLRNDADELGALSAELKLGIEEYVFVLTNWFKPWLIQLRGTQEQQEELFEPLCPFCGYLPDMSKIVESMDNVRLLHCGLCENEWAYKRISCVICGNEDKETQGFYIYDDDPAYRVDYCDECKGYIKTVRVPRGLEASRCDLAVENIITAFLDSSAMELGYSRP